MAWASILAPPHAVQTSHRPRCHRRRPLCWLCGHAPTPAHAARRPRRGHPRQRAAGAIRRRRVRRRAARQAARVRARAARRRAGQPASVPCARLLRAARRRRRDPLRGVAERLGVDPRPHRRGPSGAPVEGMQVVVAGGCDFYPGSATSSPGFSFSVSDLRVAGEGDLLARIERLRRQLDAEGLLAPQKLLARPAAATHDRRGDRRERQGARGHPRGPGPSRLGRTDRVGVRARAGPSCRPADRARAHGPRRGRRRRCRDRRARRRLAGGPAVLLRGVAVPHRRAAGGARDRLGRTPHRPHAARRRRGRQLLHPHPRRRGRRRPGLRARTHRADHERPRACASTAAARCSRAQAR